MKIETYQQTFWESWPNEEKEKPDTTFRHRINEVLREMYYRLGFKKVEALETIEGLITEGKVYTVQLVKDEHFPEGEEAIVSDSEEYVTLPVFKHKILD